MVFFWVADAGGGGFVPVQQGIAALVAGQRHGVGQPRVKRCGRSFVAGAEQPQVVIAETRAYDQHALITQRGYGATEGEMCCGVVAVLQRDLEDWNFGVGIHHISGREGAVIEAAFGV